MAHVLPLMNLWTDPQTDHMESDGRGEGWVVQVGVDSGLRASALGDFSALRFQHHCSNGWEGIAIQF